MSELPPLPPRKAVSPPAQRGSGSDAPKKASQSSRAKPDPRPMRVVYGAGAVAAVSVMTIGLVQPSWDTAPESRPIADDANTAGGPLAASAPDNGSADRTRQSAGDVQVRHVIRYVHLKPGEHAPPGATVITPGAPTPRVITVHSKPTNSGPPVAHANPPTQSGPPAAAPPPAPKPPAPPPPRTSTHQSGRPR